jgi:hypothetical protein
MTISSISNGAPGAVRRAWASAIDIAGHPGLEGGTSDMVILVSSEPWISPNTSRRRV